MRIGYIVHDLNDAAVAKRCAILRRGGAEVTLAGFRRGSAPQEVSGVSPFNLGETADGALAQRTAAVLSKVASPDGLRSAMKDADMLMARNLESLALAHRIADGRPVVYECLDIHRSLLNEGMPGRVIRKIEQSLVERTAAIITSSPGFIREYFDRRPFGDTEIRLEENKILLAEGQPAVSLDNASTPEGPPWVIGWFGMLRCKRTFRELSSLTAELNGKVQVLIAGKPSPAELPDFAEQVEAAPFCDFIGPYKPTDLPSLYARCHYAWAIDWFEEGQNSEWLLPNRLYEATAFGTVPIVLKRHEVGRWLAEKDAGLQIENTDGLAPFFERLDQSGYNRMHAAIGMIPRSAIVMGDAECREFTSWLQGLA